jgi:chaperonin cofactor prefoldin
LTESQILTGKVDDLNRRCATLERDMESLEMIITSVQDEIKYMKRKMREALNV